MTSFLVSAVAMLACAAVLPAAAATRHAFAAALDERWDYGAPDASEARFREAFGQAAPGSPQALEILTQIARAQGLQRRFDEAHRTLDTVERALPEATAHVRVRYLLERGRALNSSGAPERATPLFREALALAVADGDDFYAVDAAHMLGIAAPVDERLGWNLHAVDLVEQSAHARAKRWSASLYNNIGWTYHDRGEFANALRYFEKALAAWQARGGEDNVLVARWSVARALRSLGRLDEAEAGQRAVLAAHAARGSEDGYVYEELGEIALARGDEQQAAPWFAKAYAALKDDPALRTDAPARLERMARLAKTAAAPR